jgi:hypothetical protein
VLFSHVSVVQASLSSQSPSVRQQFGTGVWTHVLVAWSHVSVVQGSFV